MSGLVVLKQMIMIFILILTGFILYKKKMISDSASKDLSALVVNVCSPGLVIVSMFNDLNCFNWNYRKKLRLLQDITAMHVRFCL